MSQEKPEKPKDGVIKKRPLRFYLKGTNEEVSLTQAQKRFMIYRHRYRNKNPPSK